MRRSSGVGIGRASETSASPPGRCANDPVPHRSSSCTSDCDERNVCLVIVRRIGNISQSHPGPYCISRSVYSCPPNEIRHQRFPNNLLSSSRVCWGLSLLFSIDVGPLTRQLKTTQYIPNPSPFPVVHTLFTLGARPKVQEL